MMCLLALVLIPLLIILPLDFFVIFIRYPFVVSMRHVVHLRSSHVGGKSVISIGVFHIWYHVIFVFCQVSLVCFFIGGWRQLWVYRNNVFWHEQFSMDFLRGFCDPFSREILEIFGQNVIFKHCDYLHFEKFRCFRPVFWINFQH